MVILFELPAQPAPATPIADTVIQMRDALAAALDDTGVAAQIIPLFTRTECGKRFMAKTRLESVAAALHRIDEAMTDDEYDALNLDPAFDRKVALDAFQARSREFAAQFDLETLFQFLDVARSHSKVPCFVFGALADAAFERLNALTATQRRAAIGMETDVYTDDTALVREIVRARTAWAVDEASGAFCDDFGNDTDDTVVAQPPPPPPAVSAN